MLLYSSTMIWRRTFVAFKDKICIQENLKLTLSKCIFVKSTINFLGYEVSNGCNTPNNSNVEAIKKLKPPTKVKELQHFWDLLIFRINLSLIILK